MHLKIFFGSRPLYLCDNIDEEVEPYIHHDDAVYIDELDVHSVKTMIHEMQLEKIHAGVFYHNNIEELKSAFFKKFTVIKAGGGLVTNEKNEVLLIFRKGSWDLPKGKLDKGETIEECAVREVVEETSLKDVSLVKPLHITYHTYHEGTKLILKESHWFTMDVKGIQEAKPQKEEGITEAIWVKKKDVPGYFDKAYPAIVDVLSKALRNW